MPFSPGQNEFDVYPIFSIADGKYAPTAGTTVAFGFRTKRALVITELQMLVDEASGGFGTLKADLMYGLAASGDVLMTVTPTAASSLTADTSVATTSGYGTSVPMNTDLAVRITVSAAGDIVTGLQVGVHGRRYNP